MHKVVSGGFRNESRAKSLQVASMHLLLRFRTKYLLGGYSGLL